MKKFFNLIGHSLGVAFIIFLYSNSSEPSMASKISCDQTVTSSEMITSFECNTNSGKKLVTLKSSDEDLLLEYKYSNLKGPETLVISEKKQEISLPDNVTQVEIKVAEIQMP